MDDARGGAPKSGPGKSRRHKHSQKPATHVKHTEDTTIEGRQQRRGAMELAETALRPPEATVWFGDIELHICAKCLKVFLIF